MIKHFIGILLGMTSMAQAMDDPKDDDNDKIMFTQTPAQALAHKALVEAIENQPDPGPIHYDAGRCLHYIEDPVDAAETSESLNKASLGKHQTRSDNKKPYFPIPQYDPDTGVWFISLIPEKSHRRPEPTTKPEASDIKTAPTVSPKTASDDDDDEE